MWESFQRAFLSSDRWIQYLKGLGISLEIAIGAIALGFLIGVICAVVKIMPKNNIFVKILDKIVGIYITVIRGTPVLLQLLMMYFVILVALKNVAGNIPIAIIAFGINSGAYMAEIIRSGINSVDRGQTEAGRSLGFSWIQTMWLIVIPQAIKNVIPTIFNEIIVLVKETSVVGYIPVVDLVKTAEKIGFNIADYLFPLTIAAVLYLIVVMLLTLVQKFLERRFARSDR